MIMVCLSSTAVAVTALGAASMFFWMFLGGAAVACVGYAKTRITQPQIAQPQIARDIRPQITDRGRFTELDSEVGIEYQFQYIY